MQKSKLRGSPRRLALFLQLVVQGDVEQAFIKSKTVNGGRLPASQTANATAKILHKIQQSVPLKRRSGGNLAQNTTIGAAEVSIWWKSCRKYNNSGYSPPNRRKSCIMYNNAGSRRLNQRPRMC
ncbi:hypothetical protein PBOR_05310 [Paenibacillus borealis]|uniref:Uncharacterized protein n=1 Tax=Paenibacillus borealis TaxID=160799 RepID=A0A089MIQ6_PAEBO|nr:hypothetical protein PBOR_05310 [Paenibacillus borealis]